jgi:hypothetical protein
MRRDVLKGCLAPAVLALMPQTIARDGARLHADLRLLRIRTIITRVDVYDSKCQG